MMKTITALFDILRI